MNVRKLETGEHGITRPLWEEVFSEDTREFLDYYYYIKAKENEIFVVEEDGELCSMLHLNPYTLAVGSRQAESAYIVAVATKEACRSRGFMRALLHTSLQHMYDRKVPFTFLMPAAEAIYRPYDFRFIYRQDVGTLSGAGEAAGGGKATTGAQAAEEGRLTGSDAALWQAGEAADFFGQNFSGRWQVYALRDAAYYQTMIMEQQSERGGVRFVRDRGQLIGMYAYAVEDGMEIREPLFLPGYEDAFSFSVRELLKSRGRDGAEQVRVSACPADMAQEEKPVIMARIVCLREFLGLLETGEETELCCSFAVLDPILKQNSRVWRIESRAGETGVRVREAEDSEGVFPVAELTEYLFGQMDMEALKKCESVILTEHLALELEKIRKLTDVFLNEIV